MVLFLVWAGIFTTISYSQENSTSGNIFFKVIANQTQKPITNCTLYVQADTTYCFFCDSGDTFKRMVFYPGIYTIRVRAQGFDTLNIPAVTLVAKQDTTIVLSLRTRDTLHELSPMLITDTLMQSKSKPSFSSIKHQELINTVGTANDLNRVLASYPGVTSFGSNTIENAIMVRGGVAYENSYLVDGMELRSVNHFFTLNLSGGAFGFINTDLVQEVNFYTGDIPVFLPPKISSIIAIKLREGKSAKPSFGCNLNIAGLGLLVDGATRNNRFRYLANARWNDLRFLEKYITGKGIPNFGDGIIKLVYQASDLMTISLVGLVSYDFLRTQPIWEDGSENLIYQKELVQSGTSFVTKINRKPIENVFGLFWCTVDDHYYQEEVFGPGAWIRRHFTHENKRQYLTLSDALVYHFNDYNHLTFGLDGRFSWCYTYYQDIRYQIDHDSTLNCLSVGGFAEGVMGTELVSFHVGIRGDSYSLITDHGISPRLGIILTLPQYGRFFLSGGMLYQLPAYVEEKLPYALNRSGNRPFRLNDFQLQRCWQGSIGYTKQLKESHEFIACGYLKWYDREYTFINPYKRLMEKNFQLINGQWVRRIHEPKGRKRSMGIEITLMKKPINRFKYSLSTSLSSIQNKYSNGRWYPDEHDIQLALKSKMEITFGKFQRLALGFSSWRGRPCNDSLSFLSEDYFNKRYDPLFILDMRYGLNIQKARFQFGLYFELMNILNQTSIVHTDGEIEQRMNGILPVGGINIAF